MYTTLHSLIISLQYKSATLYTEKYKYDATYSAEAESKEKHRVWDPMPELTITSPYVHSRVDSNTFTMGNPMPELIITLARELTLSPSQGLRIWPQDKSLFPATVLV